MACDYSQEDILTWLYGEMPPDAATAFEHHLMACPTCRDTVTSFKRTQAALDEAPDVALPAKLAGPIEPPRTKPTWRQAVAALVAVAALLLVLPVIDRNRALGELRIVPKGMELTVFSEGAGDDGAYQGPAQGQMTAQMDQLPLQMFADRNDAALVNVQTAEMPIQQSKRRAQPSSRWGLALIKDKRSIFNLPNGDTEIKFTDVAATIDPETVRFESLTDPAAAVVREQNFEFDLASPRAILKRYVEKPITIISTAGDMSNGFLASFDRAQLVVSSKPEGGQPQIIPTVNINRIQLENLPDGLVTRPTLRWIVRNTKPGDHETLVSYLAAGMQWRADYVVVVNPGDTLDLTGWVTLVNQSGSSYLDAKLKLLAGDVHRVREPEEPRQMYFAIANAAKARGGAGFEEKAFFEYHLYTLQRPATLLDKQTKQLRLLEASGIKTTREYVFDAQRGVNAHVALKFKNEEKNHLGMPLPKGAVRIMMKDPDGEEQLHNEDRIDHTPKDEKMELTLGAARGLTGERAQTNYRQLGDRANEISIQVRLRNHRDEPVDIVVREHMNAGAEWNITAKSADFEKEDVNTVRFVIPVPANAERSLTYTVQNRW